MYDYDLEPAYYGFFDNSIQDINLIDTDFNMFGT